MMPRWLPRAWLSMLLGLPGATAWAIEPETHWAQPFFTRLDVRFPGQGFHARWDFHRCDCGDALIKAEETLPEGVSAGELLLVDGRVLLVRGFEGRGADRRSMIDSPLLMLQLLFVLMQKALPEGPAELGERRELSHSDVRYPLELETGGAMGGFPAPWEVNGVAYRFADGSHRFDLEFGFETRLIGEPVNRSEIQLSGILDFRAQEFPIAEDFIIEDWDLVPLIDAESGAYDSLPEGTLAALRQRVREAKITP